MQFSTLAISALSVGSALAASATSSAAATSTGAVTVHVVRVGSTNGSLAYFPNSLTAAVGDMVQFQFAPANHTVTQSTFDQPCQPISANNAAVAGIYSGFMPVTAASTTTPTYTIQINNTTPIWLYCSQGKHCQNGMTMVINENVKANASRSLANFQALAAKSTVNLPGTSVSGGASGTNSSSESTAEGGASTTSSSSSSKSTSASGASANARVSQGLGMTGLFALVMAFVL